MQDILVFVVIGVAVVYLGFKWFRKGTNGCGCGCDCSASKANPKELVLGDRREKK